MVIRNGQSPFEAGKAAKLQGYPKSQNPFNRGTKEFVEWMKGWNDV